MANSAMLPVITTPQIPFPVLFPNTPPPTRISNLNNQVYASKLQNSHHPPLILPSNDFLQHLLTVFFTRAKNVASISHSRKPRLAMTKLPLQSPTLPLPEKRPRLLKLRHPTFIQRNPIPPLTSQQQQPEEDDPIATPVFSTPGNPPNHSSEHSRSNSHQSTPQQHLQNIHSPNDSGIPFVTGSIEPRLFTGKRGNFTSPSFREFLANPTDSPDPRLVTDQRNNFITPSGENPDEMSRTPESSPHLEPRRISLNGCIVSPRDEYLAKNSKHRSRENLVSPLVPYGNSDEGSTPSSGAREDDPGHFCISDLGKETLSRTRAKRMRFDLENKRCPMPVSARPTCDKAPDRKDEEADGDVYTGTVGTVVREKGEGEVMRKYNVQLQTPKFSFDGARYAIESVPFDLDEGEQAEIQRVTRGSFRLRCDSEVKADCGKTDDAREKLAYRGGDDPQTFRRKVGGWESLKGRGSVRMVARDKQSLLTNRPVQCSQNRGNSERVEECKHSLTGQPCEEKLPIAETPEVEPLKLGSQSGKISMQSSQASQPHAHIKIAITENGIAREKKNEIRTEDGLIRKGNAELEDAQRGDSFSSQLQSEEPQASSGSVNSATQSTPRRSQVAFGSDEFGYYCVKDGVAVLPSIEMEQVMVATNSESAHTPPSLLQKRGKVVGGVDEEKTGKPDGVCEMGCGSSQFEQNHVSTLGNVNSDEKGEGGQKSGDRYHASKETGAAYVQGKQCEVLKIQSRYVGDKEGCHEEGKVIQTIADAVPHHAELDGNPTTQESCPFHPEHERNNQVTPTVKQRTMSPRKPQEVERQLSCSQHVELVACNEIHFVRREEEQPFPSSHTPGRIDARQKEIINPNARPLRRPPSKSSEDINCFSAGQPIEPIFDENNSFDAEENQQPSQRATPQTPTPTPPDPQQERNVSLSPFVDPITPFSDLINSNPNKRSSCTARLETFPRRLVQNNDSPSVPLTQKHKPQPHGHCHNIREAQAPKTPIFNSLAQATSQMEVLRPRNSTEPSPVIKREFRRARSPVRMAIVPESDSSPSSVEETPPRVDTEKSLSDELAVDISAILQPLSQMEEDEHENEHDMGQLEGKKLCISLPRRPTSEMRKDRNEGGRDTIEQGREDVDEEEDCLTEPPTPEGAGRVGAPSQRREIGRLVVCRTSLVRISAGALRSPSTPMSTGEE